MSPTKTFYWHDYETWGADPRRDRAAQFAGVRTDLDFNPVGKPLLIYACPADDMLPHPEACMITGLTPQQCREEGVPEADFFTWIHAELVQSGTCALGYNSLRFDDEFTRYGLYRNFFDPYAREWQNGNSRWDLIDVVRLTRALRPEGIEWPCREDGSTSFRLEELTAANDIAHEGAHDALADVNATIAMAKKIRAVQPRLFDYTCQHRDKHRLKRLLDPRDRRPVLHVSARYPARMGCIAAVLPLAWHPVNPNGVIVYDLRQDPAALLTLPITDLKERLYTPTNELPDDVKRIALKTVHVNRAPIIVPMNTLTEFAREQWQMPKAEEQRHLRALLDATGLAAKLQELFAAPLHPPIEDPDQNLYGGFMADADRRRCHTVRSASPEQLAELDPAFDDPKLTELLFRYRARNWPETLNREERKRWDVFRRRRLTDPDCDASICLKAYRRKLSHLAIDAQLSEWQRAALDALIDWPTEIGL